MKLTTERGELPLPEDFSFEIESNNPLFSDEGTASVPATIPPDDDAFDLLSRPERPGRSHRHVRIVPAVLQHGLFQRRCNMLVDTCSHEEGISVTLAFSESEMYSRMKDMQLKEIFGDDKVQPDFLENTSIEDKVLQLWYSCYTFRSPLFEDLRIFPVAVDLDDNDGATSVQLLNRQDPSSYQFLYQARTETIGGEDVRVPKGYGVTPFILLHRLIHLMFRKCGYSVRRNDFSEEPFASIVVLNNCADTLCRNAIFYRDLVPSMTAGDFIAWLKDRFNAFVRVTHNTVDIIMAQNAIRSAPDMDLSSMVREGLSLSYPPSSRVVLKCSTDLDSAQPAAETLPKLRQKHSVIRSIGHYQDPGADCMIFRKDLGKYYVVSSYQSAASYKEELAGSNCFTYDRENSEDTEEFSASDRFVPEIVSEIIPDFMGIMPYIGTRLHYNTVVADAEEEEEQPLQICYALWDHRVGQWIGNTQPYFLDGTPVVYYPGSKQYPVLTPDGLYGICWEAYNNLLLNSAPEIEAQIDFTAAQLLSLDMASPKLLHGQKVMIKSISYEVSHKGIRCGKCRLQLLPEYVDAVSDAPVEFSEGVYIWEYVNTLPDKETELRMKYNVNKLEYIAGDAMEDYLPEEAPEYVPDRAGIQEKRRSRLARYRIFIVEEDLPREETVVYAEYFLSVYAASE